MGTNSKTSYEKSSEDLISQFPNGEDVNQLSQTIARHRWKMLLFGVICALGLTFSSTKLEISNDIQSILDENHSQIQTIDKVAEDFDVPRSFVVFIEHEFDQLNRRSLELIEQLTVTLEAAPSVTSARSLTNSTYIFSDQNQVNADYIFDSSFPDIRNSADYDQIKEWLLDEPTLVHSFISDDAKITSVVLNTSLGQSASTEQIAEVHAFISEKVAEFVKLNPDYQLYIAGELAFALTRDQTFQNDLQQNMTASFALIFIILLILFRSILSAALVFVISVLACTSSLGVAGLIGLQINHINLTAPIIVFVVTALSGIHFINMFNQQRKLDTAIGVISTTWQRSFKPITLTSLTTATGFLTLNVSSSPAITSLGNIAAIGIAMGWILTFTILPALVTISKPKQDHFSERLLGRILTWFQNLVTQHARNIVLVYILLLLLCITQIAKIVIDDDPFNSFDDSLPFVKTQKILSEQMYAEYFTLYFDTETIGGIHNTQLLSAIDSLTEWLKTQQGVVNAFSYVDHIKRINKVLNADDEAFYKIPEDDALIAQYGLLYQFSIPSPDELSRYTDIEQSKIAVTVLIDELSRNQFNKLAVEINKRMDKNELLTDGKLTGWSVIFNSEIMLWVYELLRGFALALLFISLQMFFFFRSIKLGLISLVPNLLPIFIIFGLWGFAQQTLNFMALIVLSASFGIVVDDTIHFISKFSDAYKKHSNVNNALRYAYQVSGRAIIITTSALAIGLGPMLFSDFLPLQSITLLITPIAITALLIDLTLLPALLMLFHKSPDPEQEPL